MEFMPSRNGLGRTKSGFQAYVGLPPNSTALGDVGMVNNERGQYVNEEMDVDDLVLSMRQDLFVDPVSSSIPNTGSQTVSNSETNYHGRVVQPGRSRDNAHHLLSNGFVHEGQRQPQLASQFYQQLLVNRGPSSLNHESVSHHAESMQLSTQQHSVYSSIPVGIVPSYPEMDLSPRMLPQPPKEPRRGSRTRSSLRRAANRLLSQSRQSVSDGETASRVKPTPPSTPRTPIETNKDAKSQTVKERLQKNKTRMLNLLKSSNASVPQLSQEDPVSSTEMPVQRKTSHRKYASAENLHETGHRGSYVHSEDFCEKPSSLYEKPVSNSSRCDSSLSRFDDIDRDSCNNSGMNDPPVGYKLRRHSSGPVYQTSRHSEDADLHRGSHTKGYHTADSDTDSGIGRTHSYYTQEHFRNDGYTSRAMLPTRDTIRTLAKKRDGPSTHTSSRNTSKSLNGPLRADHTIHPGSSKPIAKRTSERSSSDNTVWTDQGARPKQANMSLETEDIRHEIFTDTPIRTVQQDPIIYGEPSRLSTVGNQHYSGDSSVLSISRPATPAYARPPSPSRSVHFKDNSLPHDRPIENSSSVQKSPDNSRHYTDVRHKSNKRSPADESQSKPLSESNGIGHTHSTYLAIAGDDTYSHASDQRSRFVSDENPYEDVRIPEEKDLRKRMSAKSSSRDLDETDSVDVLYAKVEKRRQRKKKDHSIKPPEAETEHEKTEAADGSLGNDEPIYAKVDKTKKKPPSGPKQPRPLSHSDAVKNSGSNPCVVSNADDTISTIGTDDDDNDNFSFKRNGLRGSRLSLASRASISEKMQSLGKATRKRFTSMRRALSLDRIDTAQEESQPQQKLKRSPSLRSLTGLFAKKDKKQDDTNSTGQLSKRRSASVSGLYVRPQRTSEETDITSPSHMRKVGKLLEINSDGSQIVELIKPPSGPFGFYIARGTSNFGSGVFVTRLGDGHPAKILAGLLSVGDEILCINGVDVRNRPIDDVYDMMMDNDKLVLQLVPIATRSMWSQ